MLVYLGAMRYSESLLDKLSKGLKMVPGERDEVEIRGASIWAVELIRQRYCELPGDDEDTYPCSR